MTQTANVAARNRGPGRPFQKGDDPRRNRGGRPKALLSAALAATLTESDAEAIMSQVIADAKTGDLQAIAMLWDRLEGKAIGRQESGTPGEFTGLEDKDMGELIELAQRRA
jgi:hypothetical protein